MLIRVVSSWLLVASASVTPFAQPTVPEPPFASIAQPMQAQQWSVPAHATTPEVVRDGYSAQARDRSWSGPAGPQRYDGARVLAIARSYVGVVPYGGGNHPSSSFSCDGFTQWVLAQVGVSLPRGANSQAARGYVITRAEAKPGDLVWWPGQHIGVYAAGGVVVDSPRPGRYVSERPIWGNPLFVRL